MLKKLPILLHENFKTVRFGKNFKEFSLIVVFHCFQGLKNAKKVNNEVCQWRKFNIIEK